MASTRVARFMSQRKVVTGLFKAVNVKNFSVSACCQREKMHRRPKKVFTSDGEEISTVQTGLEDNEQARFVAKEAAMNMYGKKRINKQFLVQVAEPNREPDSQDNIVEEEEEEGHGIDLKTIPRFKKIQGWERDSKDIKKLSKNLSHYSKNDDTVVLENKRLILDAMKEGFHPSIFVFTRLNLLKGFQFDLSKDISMYQIPYRELKLWSELKTHPGFMAAFSRSEIENKVASKNMSECLPITLLLDNVRGPDNLGAILRVAAAIGCRKVIAMRGCVDPWQSKVIRAAAGAHFYMPIEFDVPWEKIHMHLPEYPQVLLTDILRRDEISEYSELTTEELSRKLIDLEEKCKEYFFEDVPAQEPFEELKGLNEEEIEQKLIDAKNKLLMEEYQKGHEVTNDEKPVSYSDQSYYQHEILDEYAALPMESKPYYEMSRHNPSQELLVIIGGETEGISARAKKLAFSHLGERIYIPISGKLDSLNVACATSVILFELKKIVSQSANKNGT